MLKNSIAISTFYNMKGMSFYWSEDWINLIYTILTGKHIINFNEDTKNTRVTTDCGRLTLLGH